MKKILRLFAFAALQLGAVASHAQATDSWPNRPVRIVHGFAPGGPIDHLARLLAAQFHEHFKQSAIVEAKPGAGGTMAARYVARSAPDGYTLFLMASGHAAAPSLYGALPYDAVNDFTMISMVAQSPFAIIANPNAKFATVQELMKKAKAAPGTIDYGSGGNGSGMHLAAALLQSRAGVRFNHVPYRGGSATALAVVSGEVPIIVTSMAGMSAYIDSGKVKPLAVTSRQRFALYPDVPTLAETVLPDFDVTAWYALGGPKNLPPAVVAKLAEMVRVTLKRPEVAEGLRLQAADAWSTTPAEAQAFVAKEVTRWTQVVRDEKISAQN